MFLRLQRSVPKHDLKYDKLFIARCVPNIEKNISRLCLKSLSSSISVSPNTRLSDSEEGFRSMSCLFILAAGLTVVLSVHQLLHLEKRDSR